MTYKIKKTPDNSQIVNIASYLPLMAKKQPTEPAIFFSQGKDKNGEVNYTHYTFEQLDQESDYIARGLDKAGIGRGVRTVLMVPPSPDFFSLTFAMFKVGAVPVMIDPGIGIGNIKDCLAQAEPEKYRDLIVRVAGYSDYFVDISLELQEEIIQRTAHSEF